MLAGFENKTGNIISIIFFLAIIFFLVINLFIADASSAGAYFFLALVSLTGLTLIAVSDFIVQKEPKIILISLFLVMNTFLLSAFISIILTRGKKFSFIKTCLTFVFLLVLCIGAVFIYILNYTDSYDKYYMNGSNANAGVILGAAVWGGNRPSPVLRERIRKGYDIYQKKIVPKLVITGGGSPNELTEGEVSKNELIKYGVAPENLLLENSSSSTVEQIQFVRDSLYNPKGWNSIILISDNFHLMRALEICSFNNINADGLASDKELSAEGTLSFCLKESLALIIFWMSGV